MASSTNFQSFDSSSQFLSLSLCGSLSDASSHSRESALSTFQRQEDEEIADELMQLSLAICPRHVPTPSMAAVQRHARIESVRPVSLSPLSSSPLSSGPDSPMSISPRTVAPIARSPSPLIDTQSPLLSPLSLSPIPGRVSPTQQAAARKKPKSEVEYKRDGRKDRDDVVASQVFKNPRDIPTPLIQIIAQTSKTVRKKKIITLNNDGEAVSKLLKKCEYDLSKLSAEYRNAIIAAAPTIETLRIEAQCVALLPAEFSPLNVRLLDGDIETVPKPLGKIIQQGIMCAKLAQYKIFELTKLFVNVRKIELYFARLEVSHLKALAVFTKLESLDLKFCAILEPQGFQQLKKLERLTHFNAISCSHITDYAIRLFTEMEMFLELRGNNRAISQLLWKAMYAIEQVPLPIRKVILEVAPTITELTLEGQFMVEVAEIDELVNIRYSNFDHTLYPEVYNTIVSTQLRARFPAEALVNLSKTFRNAKKIVLHHGVLNADHYAAFSHFPKLETLELHSCTITEPEALRSFSQFKVLRDLCFSYCEGINDESLEYLRGLSQLTSLRMGAIEQITNKGAAAVLALKQLQVLELTHTYISDKVLLYIAQKFKNLKRVNLTGCPLITDKGVSLLNTMGLLSLNTMGCRNVGHPDIDWMAASALQQMPANASSQLFRAEELDELAKAAAAHWGKVLSKST
jgi:hypothetical protein